MVKRYTEKNPNLVSVVNAAWRTFALYIAVNMVAFGWALIFRDFGGDFSLRLHNLSLSIDGEVIGLTWRDKTTKILLLIIFLALIFRDFMNGRARLRAPDATEDEGLN